MSYSRLDKIYRKVLLSNYFTKGWGSPDVLERLFNFRKVISDREKCVKLVPVNHPVTILRRETMTDCQILEGKITTPFAVYLPDVVPKESVDAYFQMVLPLQWKSQSYRPICIHFAGTGDHYFWRRRNFMAKPLLKYDIASIILENPFYGLRKPVDQYRSSLHNVSDIFVMGGCLILECIALLRWCEEIGFGPLGVSGVSMGGHMASLAATNWPKPLVLVPCLSWSTASAVFTEGVMSDAIDWDLLQKQYISNSKYYNTLSKMCTIVDDPFDCKLSRVSELTLSSLKDVIMHMTTPKSLSPHDVLLILKAATSNCVALSCSESNERKMNILSIIPHLLKASSSVFSTMLNISEMRKRDREAVWFMKGIMDECTHLKNFSIPVDTSLVIAMCAKADSYVPREGCSHLGDLWPGSTVRYLDCGHVSAYLWYGRAFRDAIVEAFERAKLLYPPPSHPFN